MSKPSSKASHPKSQPSSPTKPATNAPSNTEPIIKTDFPEGRPAAIHMQNIAHIIQKLQSIPAPLVIPPGSYVHSQDDASAIEYLDVKAALFPQEKLLARRAPKPKKRDRPAQGPDEDTNVPQDDPASSDAEATSRSDRSSPPIYGMSLNSDRARKRARLEKGKGGSSLGNAPRWTQTIGRLVKGKSRLTPELISEVSAVLTEVENAREEIVLQPDILQLGLYDAMKLLADAQDNVYSLEGLRERAQRLSEAWRWIQTR